MSSQRVAIRSRPMHSRDHRLTSISERLGAARPSRQIGRSIHLVRRISIPCRSMDTTTGSSPRLRRGRSRPEMEGRPATRYARTRQRPAPQYVNLAVPKHESSRFRQRAAPASQAEMAAMGSSWSSRCGGALVATALFRDAVGFAFTPPPVGNGPGRLLRWAGNHYVPVMRCVESAQAREPPRLATTGASRRTGMRPNIGGHADHDRFRHPCDGPGARLCAPRRRRA
jgi:hypothetical protein